jgi:hypothetical protein
MELFINNIPVDLNDRVPFPLTFNIADVKDLSARKGNNSKTISLPGTKSNLALMSNVFNVTTSEIATGNSSAFVNFDPSVKATARYYNNGLLEFQGVCQLQECILNDGFWIFNIIMISENIDYIARLAKIKINELGWSEYDHAYTRANQVDSWDGIVQYNGSPVSVYSSPDWDGTGYYYGLIDYGYDRTGPQYFGVDQIAPQVHCYEILKKGFDIAGIQWDSLFLESQLFKKLLLAWGGGDLPVITAAQSLNDSAFTEEQNNGSGYIIYGAVTISPQQFQDQGGITQLYTFGAQSLLDDYGCTIVQDDSSQIDILAPMRFVAASEGLFNLNYYGDHEFKWDISFQFGAALTNAYAQYYVDILVYKNNIFMFSDEVYTGVISGSTMSYTVAYNFDYNRQMNLLINDTITIKVRLRIPQMNVTGNTVYYEQASYTTSVESTSAFLDIVKVQQNLTAGGTVTLSSFMPDMDLATFFKGMITAFNLYVKPSVENPSILEIEPLNDFYNDSSDALIWTDIVDTSKPIKVVPTVNFSSKNYIFEFSNDDDYFNTRYFEDVQKQYGSFLVQSQNQFASDDTDLKLPFSQKLLVKIPLNETTYTDLIVPRAFQMKINEDGTTEMVTKKGKPFIVQLGPMTTGDWYHVDENDVANFETTYPYVGHLDDLTTPTFDFNWGAPYYVFWQTSAYTSNNLYNYHEKFLKEIISPFGKQVTLSVKLDSALINRLDFRNLINIDGVVYRLQKVSDYDSGKNETTEIELIRILEGENISTHQMSIPYDPFGKLNVRETEDGEFRETEDGADNRRIE